MRTIWKLGSRKGLSELTRTCITARGRVCGKRVDVGTRIGFEANAANNGSHSMYRVARSGYKNCAYRNSFVLCNAQQIGSSSAGYSNELSFGGYVITAPFTTANHGGLGGRASTLLDSHNDGLGRSMQSDQIEGYEFHHDEFMQMATEKPASVCMANQQKPGFCRDDNLKVDEPVQSSNTELTDNLETSHRAELHDRMSKRLKKQQTFHSLQKECQDQTNGGVFYEDVKVTVEAGEPLMPRCLLDLAVEDFMHKENEQGHLLWQRFRKAAAMRGGFTCESVLATWLIEGNMALWPALMYSILAFRSWKKNKRALELFDWVRRQKSFQLTDIDHAIYMDLVGKVEGCKKASKYLSQIPKSLQSSTVYSVLLAAYIERDMDDNARKLLHQARSVGLTEQAFLFNQVLLFYKGKGRISDVAVLLKEMEELGVEADLSTYNIILDLRARKGDVSGMRRLLKYLEDERNIKPDAASYALLAKGYLNAGLYDRAEKAVKLIESSPYPREQVVYRWLLKLYAQLKREDHIERVWDMLKSVSKSLVDDYSIMVGSLGEAGEINRAEEVFKEGVRKFGVKRLHQYHTLISVFLNHGLIKKAEVLVKEMTKDAFNPGPATYHQLIQLYVKIGDGKKAMETLRKAQDASKIFSGHKPWYASYLTMLQMFGEKGDVEQAELIVKELKGTGYPSSFKMYHALLMAYVKANVMPHAFLDRIRADGVIPNSHIRKELEKVMDNRRELYEVNGIRRYLF